MRGETKDVGALWLNPPADLTLSSEDVHVWRARLDIPDTRLSSLEIVLSKTHYIFDLLDPTLTQFSALIGVRFSGHPMAKDKEFHLLGCFEARLFPAYHRQLS